MIRMIALRLAVLLVVFATLLSIKGLPEAARLTISWGAACEAEEWEGVDITRRNAKTEGCLCPFGRNEEEVDALEREGLKRYGINPAPTGGGLFGKRGILGEPIRAQSGERLETRWEGFFPRYRLYYFPSREHRGVVIGECRFPDGCNNGFFFGPDADDNGIPDSFRFIQWVSSDYGGDDGVPGYLDRYRYIYDVHRDRRYLWHDLLIYRRNLPLSVSPDTCRITSDPPYEMRTFGGKTYPRIFKTDFVEEKSLLERE